MSGSLAAQCGRLEPCRRPTRADRRDAARQRVQQPVEGVARLGGAVADDRGAAHGKLEQFLAERILEDAVGKVYAREIGDERHGLSARLRGGGPPARESAGVVASGPDDGGPGGTPDQPALLYQLGTDEAVYYTLVNLLVLIVVTLLAGYLAERLRLTGGQLVRAEKRAEQAEQLAVLGKLAAGLAHEIRNPLGSIAGSIQLLRYSPSDVWRYRWWSVA